MRAKSRLALIIIPLIGFLLVLASAEASAFAPSQEGRQEEETIPQARTLMPTGNMAAASVAYTITDLGPTTVKGISEDGAVVGIAYSPSGDRSLFLWQNGAMTELSVPAATQPGWVYAVNRAHQAVGYFTGSTPVNGFVYRSATLWANGARTSLLDSPEPESSWQSYAHDINEEGLVVGYVTTWDDENIPHNSPFIWQDGAATILSPFGGELSYANATNKQGQIAGWFTDRGISKPVLWLPETDYGLPAGANTLPVFTGQADDINDHTQIVGQAYFTSASPMIRAFVWLLEPAYGQPEGIVDLGALDGRWSRGYAINNVGQVVGQSPVASSQNAFLWQNGLMVDLNELIDPASGWHLRDAVDINDAGQIIGQGALNGEPRAYLLTPHLIPWTQIHYFAADNDLADTFPAIFQELEANADNENVNILVLWDRSDGDDAYYQILFDSDRNQLANYIPDENVWYKPEELDTSQSYVLSDFLTWAITNYPSQHYALFLNDHGNGLGGGLVDDTSNRTMSLAEMKLALATAFEATGRKIDVLYMDMCLMGMLEAAYQVRDYADYYVASEDIQFAYSDPYSVYAFGIDGDSKPTEVAQLFAGAYADTAKQKNQYYAMAAADISRLDELVAATNQLAAALMANMSDIFGTLSTVLLTVQRLDSESPKGIDLNDTYVDLYDFADQVRLTMGDHADIVVAAEAVKSAVKAYVIYEDHGSSSRKNLDNTHGVAIFYPSIPSVFYHPDHYDFAVGATWEESVESATAVLPPGKTWGAMLVNYFALTQPDGPVDTTPPLPVPKEPPAAETGLHLPLLAR